MLDVLLDRRGGLVNIFTNDIKVLGFRNAHIRYVDDVRMSHAHKYRKRLFRRCPFRIELIPMKGFD
jgi:hypothetical protein